ncbi:hypothetical protein DSO57_1002079 [Entomophthora muscae]|uniref:Uncharacterized protein n=1 Tax=Entomophthora muscae TaxID=34485 RepID=A0ACC2RZZ0_9FUNG|nr:hypothetical protein DSO57_1002079 [Entomophthora muscae]
MFGRFIYLGHLGHLAIITVPIGLLIAGLNLGALAHQLGNLFPAKWVPDISKDKGISLAAPIALLYLDLLEPSPVNHNIRSEDSAKDDDVVLHEVEIVGLHTFKKPPLSLPKPLSPEDPGTSKPFPIGAGDCFKNEKVSEDDEASQE